MTSPGLIERSMSSTKPLTKFDAMDCRPNPKPTPMAPVSTVSVVRSTPAVFSPTRMLNAIRQRVGELGEADAGRGREGAQPLEAAVDPAADPHRHEDEEGQGEEQLSTPTRR